MLDILPEYSKRSGKKNGLKKKKTVQNFNNKGHFIHGTAINNSNV